MGVGGRDLMDLDISPFIESWHILLILVQSFLLSLFANFKMYADICSKRIRNLEMLFDWNRQDGKFWARDSEAHQLEMFAFLSILKYSAILFFTYILFLFFGWK